MCWPALAAVAIGLAVTRISASVQARGSTGPSPSEGITDGLAAPSPALGEGDSNSTACSDGSVFGDAAGDGDFEAPEVAVDLGGEQVYETATTSNSTAPSTTARRRQ